MLSVKIQKVTAHIHSVLYMLNAKACCCDCLRTIERTWNAQSLIPVHFTFFFTVCGSNVELEWEVGQVLQSLLLSALRSK
jgi:hypothetical protein